MSWAAVDSDCRRDWSLATIEGAAYLTGPNNQLLFDGVYGYSYDREGNRTARFIDVNANGLLDADDTAATTYAWDHRNRLTRVTDYATYGDPATRAIDYLYDTENRWIGRDVDLDADGQIDSQTRFAYDGNQIVLQFDRAIAPTDDPADPLTQEHLSHRYLWDPAAVDQLMADEHVTTPDSPGSILWPLADHLGTIRDLAAHDSSADATTIVNHRVFDAYGNLQSQTSATVDCLFGFTGRPLDQTTGLQNNLHRWYDAATGRWMSEDPIGFEGRDGNLSAYVGNGPLNGVDPLGLAVYAGWGHWDVLRWRIEGDIWTTGVDQCNNPIWGDNLFDYAKTKMPVEEQFTMTFQFKFEGGYVQPWHPSKELQPRPGFVSNSGVYIYNAIEVQIIDTRTIAAMLDRVEDGKVYIREPNGVPEGFYTVLSGITYDRRIPGDEHWFRNAHERMYSRDALERMAKLLKPEGEWNTMEIRFLPHEKNGVLWAYTLRVFLNGEETWFASSRKPTRGGIETLGAIRDFHLYLQSHHGSRVSFTNMIIRTGSDAVDLAAPATQC